MGPLSYAWLPLARHNPEWVSVLVPPAEVGAVVLAIAATWSGVQATRQEGDSSAARWGIALGALTLALVVADNVLGAPLVA